MKESQSPAFMCALLLFGPHSLDELRSEVSHAAAQGHGISAYNIAPGGLFKLENKILPYLQTPNYLLEDLLSKKRISFENQVDSSGILSLSVVVVPGECISLLDSYHFSVLLHLLSF
ncbi:hypothetical protein NFI96_002636 [Prochilodus magdalenae]|nr:hypothetical protein NFI96_002636 [Prochilodus magdalenae]